MLGGGRRHFSSFILTNSLLVFCILIGILNCFNCLIQKNVIVKSWRASDYMYLEIVQPSVLSYFYKLSPARDFGHQFNFTFYSAKLTPSQPAHGCSRFSNSRSMHTRLALIERGGCSFVTKALNAHKAGALAAIVYDSDPDSEAHVSMVDDGTYRNVPLPSLFLSGKDGHRIRRTLHSQGIDYALANVPVNLTTNRMYMVRQPPWNLW